MDNVYEVIGGVKVHKQKVKQESFIDFTKLNIII